MNELTPNKAGLQVCKSYWADPKMIRIIPGFNIRPVDRSYVDELALAYLANHAIPPVLVARGEDGQFELVDGEHRVRAAIQVNMDYIPITIFCGSMTERLATALNSSRKLLLTATQRAKAYMRMRNEGWSDHEIAGRTYRSEGDVANYLLIARCGDKVMDMIDAEIIKPTNVVDLARKFGPEQVLQKIEETIKRKHPESKKTGNPVRVKKSDFAGFDKKDAFAVTKLIADVVPLNLDLANYSDDDFVQITMPVRSLRQMTTHLSKLAG